MLSFPIKDSGYRGETPVWVVGLGPNLLAPATLVISASILSLETVQGQGV